ncbi:XrtA-associated tyrosine autokinase [Noviherbaspirillum galbum]|uniref:non-specific protein-tyrosine kinase n=1 Tax=Noviherbaspirillum galbum TaxID=2709383 RepID=A0A6B3SY48_9BURK|nr:XrtA-associated tyrosine autokinase [Noviherbaspirillum galbum]NEX64186.1 tyrosine-protein kinase family protein [Noviherbaspirillum galbum]
MSIIENAARRLEQAQPVPNAAGNRNDTPLPEHAGMKPIERLQERIQRDRERDQAQTLAAEPSFAPVTPLPRNLPESIHPRQYAKIDLDRMHELGMVVSNGERTSVGEEFRIIKRPLLRNALPVRAPSVGKSGIPNPPNLIMVTSSLPKEGKTFCAINLAMSIATEKDYTVLLVDADVARPSVLKTLGIQADTGLLDLLRNPGMDVAETIIHTNVPSLSIIPAGQPSRHATELLASHDMARLLQELAMRYPDRIVIFDSPPLMATTEAQVLAQHMGQVVVVVEAERTTQKQLKEALTLIEGCSNVSLVFNKARLFATEAKYGSY